MSIASYFVIALASIVGVANILPPTVSPICYANTSELSIIAPETLRAPMRDEFISDSYYFTAVQRFQACGNWAS